jgi:prepilin-type N-terminal cleavage/methylation domain-containing protein
MPRNRDVLMGCAGDQTKQVPPQGGRNVMKKNIAQRGFTLMELMVVIVIVAILAAVAVPLYINYVNDARNTEAKGAIGAVITAEQAYRQQTGTYTADTFVPNPTSGTGGTQILNCDLTDALNNWTISVALSSGTTPGFTVTATGKSGGPTAGRSVAYTYPPTAGQDPWTTN